MKKITLIAMAISCLILMGCTTLPEAICVKDSDVKISYDNNQITYKISSADIQFRPCQPEQKQPDEKYITINESANNKIITQDGVQLIDTGAK